MKKTMWLVIIAGTLAIALPHRGAAEGGFVGQKLPELKLDYLEQAPDIVGKPLLLEFWATWCPPCRKSIPHLNEIYAQYRDRGLVIIGVTNEKKSDVKKFLKEVPIHYTVAFDDGKLGTHFQIRGIPHAFLANAEGEIVWQGHPMTLRKADIEKVLKPRNP